MGLVRVWTGFLDGVDFVHNRYCRMQLISVTVWILQFIPIQFLTGADSWPIRFQDLA